MTALVISSSPSVAESLGPAMFVLLMVPVLMVFAPQPIRRDKRTVAVLVALAAIVVGVPAYAVICNICTVCLGEWWFLFIECWFI
jgi:hypothetical protein